MSTPTLADMMAAYAADAVDVARANFQTELDYSFESLRNVDRILSTQHNAIPTGWRKLIRRGPNEKTLQSFAKIWGGYIGEVFRRRWGGEWLVPKTGAFQNAIALTIVGDTLSPPARAYKHLVNGEEDSVWSYARVFEQMLSTTKDHP